MNGGTNKIAISWRPISEYRKRDVVGATKTLKALETYKNNIMKRGTPKKTLKNEHKNEQPNKRAIPHSGISHQDAAFTNRSAASVLKVT